jgi:hypothetical protein
VAERVAFTVIRTALSIVGFVMIALGLTFLPIIGILAAFPLLTLAFYCFKPGRWTVSAESKPEPVAAKTWAEESMAA